MATTRPRRSASERHQLVHRWQQSGQSKAAFAKHVGVSINTFRRWLTAAKPQFVEVIQAKPVVAPRDFMVHVGEFRIQVPHGFDGPEFHCPLPLVLRAAGSALYQPVPLHTYTAPASSPFSSS